ncbi:MAG: hypothetical protein KJ709_00605 [Nanoarchaeota archaeon]|nr:hypothetical protein [Nanoarchaeota archaeon]
MKKGVFYTIISFMIVGVLFIFYSSTPMETEQTELAVVQDRISQADTFIHDLEHDYLEHIVRATGYQTLYSLTEEMKDRGQTGFFLDLEETFGHLMMTGQIGIDDIPSMQGKTLDKRLLDLKANVDETLFIDLTYKNPVIEVYQDDATGPWALGLNLTLTLDMKTEAASWTKTLETMALLDISGLEDPFFNIHTDGNVDRLIVPTEIADWDSEALKEHLDAETYVHNERAPSFFDRLRNNIVPSACCGIESMISPDVINAGIVKQMSYVDHCYFSELCPGSEPGNVQLFNVDGITTQNFEFMLEPYHISFYNISNEEIEQVIP